VSSQFNARELGAAATEFGLEGEALSRLWLPLVLVYTNLRLRQPPVNIDFAIGRECDDQA
jgi:hypothetical protein